MNNKIHIVSNAHLDPIWLWRWQEGCGEVLQTFRSAVDRIKEYKGLGRKEIVKFAIEKKKTLGVPVVVALNKSDVNEKKFMDEIRTRNGNLTIILSD